MQNKQSLSSMFIFITMLFIISSVLAQSYKTGSGLRFGGLSSGLTVKHFISTTSALESILSVARKGFIVTGLYEKHNSVDHSNLFKFYYGGGGHIGFFQDGGGYYFNSNRVYTKSTMVGLDGIVGMEYKFKGAPINIGMDFKPFIDFFNGNTVYFDGGLNIRYAF